MSSDILVNASNDEFLFPDHGWYLPAESEKGLYLRMCRHVQKFYRVVNSGWFFFAIANGKAIRR